MASGRPALTGVKEGCGWWRNMQLPGRVSRVVCSSILELAQPPNKLSSHRTQDDTGSEHGQVIWDEEWLISWIEPPGNISTLHNSPGGHTSISVNCHVAPGGDESQGPCRYLWSRIILIMCFALPGGFVIVLSFYLSHSLLDISYILSLWTIVSKTIALHHPNCKMSSLPFLSLLDFIPLQTSSNNHLLTSPGFKTIVNHIYHISAAHSWLIFCLLLCSDDCVGIPHDFWRLGFLPITVLPSVQAIIFCYNFSRNASHSSHYMVNI